VKNVYVEQACLNDINNSKKDESPYKTVSGEFKEGLQKCLAENRKVSVRILEEVIMIMIILRQHIRYQWKT
jgi:hypothetical protein